MSIAFFLFANFSLDGIAFGCYSIRVEVISVTENDRVKAIRKAKNMTLDEFGKQIGKGRSSISDIENGRRSLTDSTRLLICQKFRVNENWLLTGEGGPDVVFDIAPESDIDKILKELKPEARDRILIEKFLALPDEGRQAVMRYALSVAQAVQGGTASQEPPTYQDGDEEDYADMARQQRLSEKERAAQASSAKESGVG